MGQKIATVQKHTNCGNCSSGYYSSVLEAF